MDKVDLYDMMAELALLLDKEDLTEEDFQRIESLEYSLELKLQAYAGYCESLEDEADALEVRAKLITARAKANRNKAQRLRDRAKYCLEIANIHSIKAGTHKISIRTNPPKVVIDCDAVIPAGYWKVEEVRTLDKTALKEDLQAGNDIPGVHLIQETRIEFK